MISCKAVIFDMDGVIVDSEPRHKAAFLKVCNEIGYGETHGMRFEDYIGRTDNDLWSDFLKRHRPSQTLDELLAMKRIEVIECIRSEKPLFDGLVDLVKCLSKTHKLALASGSDRGVVDEVLQIEGLHRYFQATVSGSEISKGKPNPEIFLKAAGLLEVAPKDCCVIEDSKPGVAAGLAAGMHVIAVTNTHPAEELTHAHSVVKSCREIQALLAS
jgi:HAD superfamily hydrolase (TIGR01509 family)